MPRSCHVCGGPVDPESPSYVVRPEEREIRQYLDTGCYVTIMGPRQIGKSTLLWGIKSRHRNAPDCRFAYLDFAELVGLDQPEWYGHVAERVAQGFDLPAHWIDSIRKPANHLGFERFLADEAQAANGIRSLYV